MSEKRQTSLTLTPVMWAYVEAMRQTGLYGDGTASVLRTLVMEGARKALADGTVERVRP